MENSIFDLAVKNFGKKKNKTSYDKAADAFINALKQNEQIYVPMKKSKRSDRYIPCIVKDGEGILLCIAGTNSRAVEQIKCDIIECMKLEKLINLCGALADVRGISFNIWDAGFTVSKEMIAFIIEKRIK